MAASMASTKPTVNSRQTAAEIAGHHTEIVVNKFEDHLFIIATQYMKLGTVVQVTRELLGDEVQGMIPMFSTNVLLGKDEGSQTSAEIRGSDGHRGFSVPLTHVMAKTIVTELDPPTSVILTLALKDTTPDTVHSITALIKSCL